MLSVRPNKKDAERETWSLAKWSFGEKSHEQRAHDSSQNRSSEHGVNGKAQSSEWFHHGRQQSQDINHGGKSGQTRDYLCFKAMAMNGEAHQCKESFFHTSKWMGIIRSNFAPRT